MTAHPAAARLRCRALVAPATGPAGALQAVRAATRGVHDSLDALLPDGLRRRGDYQRYLAALLPLADRLARGWRDDWPAHLRDWHAPQRSARLRHDIEVLADADDASAEPCDARGAPGSAPWSAPWSPRSAPPSARRHDTTSPPIATTPAEWLGGCYVLEGSALGARILARDLDGLAEQYPEVADARRFIDRLTDDPGRWRRFTRLLDALPAADIDAATSGARAGFALVHAGLSGQGDAR